MKRSSVFLSLFLVANVSFAAVELNTSLMRSTFQLEGQSKKKGEVVVGTAFILAMSSRLHPSKAYYVLVTAAHLLEQMAGDKANLYLRKKKNGHYVRVLYQFSIRHKGQALWVRHPDVDVAAMYVVLPEEIDIAMLSTRFLATDHVLKKYEIHPGDELMVLGFPYGVGSNKAGFPILRSGKIASYPITPTKKAKSFLFDFQVFEGNSGGPVYFTYEGRFYQGAYHTQKPVQYIVGLVSRGVSALHIKKKMFSKSAKKYPLVLAEVIPANFILETLELLQDSRDFIQRARHR